MGSVKIKAADSWFSKCIRERAGWKCERCGAQHEKNSQGLHCSHYYGRGSWGVRFDPDNCEALCYGCHSYMGANPSLHREHKIEMIGVGLMEILTAKKNDSSLGRMAKRAEKEISKHYREQLKIMESKRDSGETGRIEFEAYL